MDFEKNLISILTNVLGEPRRDYTSSGGWIEYNCPCCSDDLGHHDDKYNFAVTTDELYGHCWKCGYSAKLSSVIRRYGSIDDLNEYKYELNALKESRFFSLPNGVNDKVEDIDMVDVVNLPDGFRLVSDFLNSENENNNRAIEYLNKRGVDEYLIRKYNIGFCSYGSGIYTNRVVIPSYDMYGDLNYWVARDYTDNKNRRKILNPDLDKKSIIFNEYFINWYEPITLVEGPFDHIVVPNSIPLLGCLFDEEHLAYKTILEKAHSRINIMLDNDATDKSYSLYKFMNAVMPGQIRIIECPDGYDPSDYYRDYGRNGIVQLLRSAHKLDEFTLMTI